MLNDDIKIPSEIISINKFLPTAGKEDLLRNAKKQQKPLETGSNTYFNIKLCNAHRGSVYIEVGETKVAVSIPAPRAINSISGNDGGAEINVSVEYKPYARKCNENLESLEFCVVREVKHALESTICMSDYTNMAFEVKVLVLQDAGNVLSSAINACSVALLIGGITTYDIISSSTICFYKNEYFSTPNPDIEALIEIADKNEPYGFMTCTTYASNGHIAQLYCHGNLNDQHIFEMFEMCSRMNEYQKLKKKKIVTKYIKSRLKLEKKRKGTVRVVHKFAQKIAKKRITDAYDTNCL